MRTMAGAAAVVFGWLAGSSVAAEPAGMPAPVCRIQFEEDGHQLADAAGGGILALAHGAVRRDGADGYGRAVDGREQWVEVPLSEALTQLEPFTVEAWCRPEALAHTYVLHGPMFALRWRMNQTGWFHVLPEQGPDLLLQSPEAYPLTFPGGTWIHMVGTYDGTTARLFMNGKLSAERAVPAGFRPRRTGHPMSIGKGYPSGEPFNGTIDEVAVYATALTAEQVAERHAWCQANFKPAPPAPKTVPGTIDGQPHNPAWKSVNLGGDWVTLSNIGEFSTPNPPILSLADAAGRRAGFYKTVTGRLTITPNAPSVFELEGETTHGLRVRETLSLSTQRVRVDFEIEAIGPQPPAPYLTGGFHMWPSAVPFTGYTTDGLVKGRLIDLEQPLSFIRGMEMVHLGMFPGRQARSIRVRHRFDSGTAYFMSAARDNLAKWVPGYANTGVRIGPADLPRWAQGDRCRIGFEFDRVPGTNAPAYDAAAARMVTRDVPFDFLATYEAAPGSLAIQLTDRPAPVFGVEESAVFLLDIPGELFSTNPTIRYRIADAFTTQLVAQSEMHPIDKWWEWQPTVEYRAGRPGAFALHVDALAADGRIVTSADQEFVVCGPIEQPVIQPGALPARTLVDQVDCLAPEPRHAFYSRSGKSHRIDTAAGPALATLRLDEMIREGVRENDWFGFRFELKHPDRVHMVEVDYPDVDNLTISVCVFEPTRPDPDNPGIAVQRVASGVQAGDLIPVSKRIQTLRTVYFSSAPWCVVQIQDLHHSHHTGAHPAAATAVRIYELDGPLPRLAGSDQPAERLFGVHSEYGDLFLGTFGDGDLRGERAALPAQGGYAASFRATENLVRYLRYRGETMYMYGITRYRSVRYPSRWFPREGPASRNVDVASVVAKMFECNGLQLTLGTLVNTPLPLGRLNDVGDWEVRHGADTCQLVSPDGLQDVRNTFFMTPNPFHPRVQDVYAKLAEELGQRYGRYASVAGIAWMCGAGWEPSLIGGATTTPQDPKHFEDVFYRYPWDDTTMAAFARRIGQPLPGDPSDPQRFRQRYDWVMQNQRAAYTDFRCEQMHALHARLRDAMTNAAPRLRHFYLDSHPSEFFMYHPGRDTAANILKAFASDPKLYANDPQLTYCRYVHEATGKRFTEHSSTPRNWAVTNLFLLTDDETARAFDSGVHSGVFLHRQFYENNSFYDPVRPWLFARPKGGQSTYLSCFSYPQPGGRAFLEDFAYMLARGTPTFICYQWQDGPPALGHEQMIAEFGAAFRKLPIGAYQEVKRDRGVFVRHLTDPAGAVFYAVNTTANEIDIAVEDTLAQGQAVRDAVTGESLAARDGALTLRLLPYQLRVFAPGK